MCAPILRSDISLDGTAASLSSGTAPSRSGQAKWIALLLLLGFLWSARLVAIKAAGLSGVPVYVTVTMAVFGIAVLFSLLAVLRGVWPPRDRLAVKFYLLSGALGFILPFTLENLAAPNLPLFVFVVVISTMPVITLILATVLGTERPAVAQHLAIGLGFCVALLIACDTARGSSSSSLSWAWVTLAFGVPILYAINTVFVAAKWPRSVDAMQVAHAQALITAAAALAGSMATGVISDLPLALQNSPAVMAIVLTEGAALLVYLKITREFGASFVSLANYVSLVFAAVLGLLFFGDHLTWLSVAAALTLVAALTLNQRKGGSR